MENFKRYISENKKYKKIVEPIVESKEKKVDRVITDSTTLSSLTIKEFKELFNSLIASKISKIDIKESELTIDKEKVNQAAIKIAKEVFKDKVDKEKVNGMIDKAISMAKDTEDAIGIFQSFFKEEKMETMKESKENYSVDRATEILDGLSDNEILLENENNEDVYIDTTDLSKLTTSDHAEALL